MLKFILYPIASPFILVGKVAEFLVWEIFSDPRWKARRRSTNPAKDWQEQAIESARQLREAKWRFRKEIESERNRHAKIEKDWEREVSYLRSRLYK